MAGESGQVRVGSAGVVEDGEGRILMALRSAHPSGIWVLPGGGVNFGERAIDAFVREIREETGIEIEEPRFLTVLELVKPEKGIHRVILFHVARSRGGELTPGDDVSELRWMTPEEIVRIENLGEVVIPVLKECGRI